MVESLNSPLQAKRMRDAADRAKAAKASRGGAAAWEKKGGEIQNERNPISL